MSGTVNNCSADCVSGTVKHCSAHCVSVAPSKTAVLTVSVWHHQRWHCSLCQCGTVKDCSAHCVSVAPSKTALLTVAPSRTAVLSVAPSKTAVLTVSVWHRQRRHCSLCQCGTVKDSTAHCVSVAPSKTALLTVSVWHRQGLQCSLCQWQPCARTTLTICNTCTDHSNVMRLFHIEIKSGMWGEEGHVTKTVIMTQFIHIVAVIYVTNLKPLKPSSNCMSHLL